MAEFDILGALEATPTRSDGRCVIQRWLDTIPAEHPDKAQLIQVIEGNDKGADTFRTQQQAQTIIRRLGTSVSENRVGDHRNQRCRCFC